MSPRCLALFFSAVLLSAAPAFGQQVTVTTPFHSSSNSFFEQQGINFGFNLHAGNPNGTGSRIVGLLPNGSFTPNGDIQFRQGLSAAAVPPFGQSDPTTTAQTGFAVLGKQADLFFGFNFGEGSRTTNSVQARMITLMNGGTGTFSDQTQFPFVTGVTPIVGGWAPGPGFTLSPEAAAALSPPSVSPAWERFERLQAGEQGPASHQASTAEPSHRDAFGQQLDAARQSTAGVPALSIAEIESQRAQVEDAEQKATQSLLDRGDQAAQAGKPGVAKIYYRMAVRDGSGRLKEEAESKLRGLSPAKTSSAAAESASR